MSKKKKKEFKELTVGTSGTETEASTIYVRTRWKHYMHWLMFGLVLLAYCILVLHSIKLHFLLHKGFLLQELIIYIICLFPTAIILPTALLEVDHVNIDPEEIVFQNLLMRRKERWENIVMFYDPRFLKFAIVRTRGFIYLINKRDMPHFNELFETIRQKAINLKK